MRDNGLTVPAWSGRRAQAALEQVRTDHRPGGPKATDRQRGTPCCECHMPLDYNSRGKPDSLTVQHVKSRRDFPHLTWEPKNWLPCHASCNYAAGADGVGMTGLGLTSI